MVGPGCCLDPHLDDICHLCAAEIVDDPSSSSTTPISPQGGVTVDSGAAANIIPPEMFEEVPEDGLHLIAASGSTIPNLGEQTIRFVTEDGSVSTATFRVADVRVPLAPIAQASDDNGVASSDSETVKSTLL